LRTVISHIPFYMPLYAKANAIYLTSCISIIARIIKDVATAVFRGFAKNTAI